MSELSILKSTIKQAGKKVMEFYGQDLNIRDKGGDSPVTQADLASEKVILQKLKQLNYGILSEETDKENKRLYQEKVWIIDPLDGTKDFIQQTGEFSIMIGLSQNGRPVLGAVYQPAEDKLFWASAGQGAYMEHRGQTVKLQVSDKKDYSEIILLRSRNHLLDREMNLAKKLSIDKMQTCGSAGLKSAKIADQFGDLYLNTSDKTGEWDVCASDIIVKEAGGVFTDMFGDNIVYNKRDPMNYNGFVVSNGKIHYNVIKELAKI